MFFNYLCSLDRKFHKMKVSYSWIKDYVNCDLTAEEAANKLTFAGLEVEEVEKAEAVKGGLKGVVVGEVIFCEKHPDSDHLSITKVNVGTDEPLNIVCGAPNVAKGQKVPVATIGTTLYFCDPPLTIKKGKLRGQVSEGMICAEDELGIGSSHAGIMVLDANAVPGTPMKDYLHLKDEYILEIGLTANRSDAMGHIGVARDLCALLSVDNYNRGNREFVPLNIPDVSAFRVDNHNLPISVTIDGTKACYRYAGVSISGVTIAESPEWMKEKLMSIGLKPINNIVDISNFVLFETGHPLHTFDADKIKGSNIIVKKLPQGSKLTTLDGIERTLSGEDLVICNSEDGMALAGVFGGIESGISENTKNIFIESAVFDPPTIRKTAKRQGLSTDASFRYERGVSPEVTVFALKRAALLIRELAGGTVSSDIVDIYPSPISRKRVDMKFSRINSLIGKKIDHDEIVFILKAMGMDILSVDDENLSVAVPSDKYDVTREADVIEEVLRIYGYNNVETDDYQHFTINHSHIVNKGKLMNLASGFLCANGYREIMNNSLCSQSLTSLVPEFNEENDIKLLNPLSKELNILRRDLVFGGLQTIAYNINRKAKDLKLFEFGNIYKFLPDVDPSLDVKKRYIEHFHLSILTTGDEILESWYLKKRKASFFDLKAIVMRMLNSVGIDTDNHKEEVTEDIFGETLIIKVNKKEIAKITVIPDNVLKYFDIQQPVYYADILWENIMLLNTSKQTIFAPVPKYPEVRRDLALLVDSEVKFADIVNIAKTRGSNLIREISLFDVFDGEKLGINKKSYAVSFIIRDNDKTLTDTQIEKIMGQLIKVFAENLNAIIR